MAIKVKVSRRKVPRLDGGAIARAVAKDLPGWNISSKRTVADIGKKAAETIDGQSGPSVRDLRKKFPGSDADASDDIGPEDYRSLDNDRIIVQVEPEGGGPAKTADIMRGKVKIVLG
jgi:hypothetical protein